MGRGPHRPEKPVFELCFISFNNAIHYAGNTMSNEITATVPVGQTYELRLESNPSTGYGWSILFEEPLQVTSDFETKSDLCGAPGIQSIKVTSKEGGTFVLTAEYKRPWENCDPLDVKKLRITFV